MLRQVSTMSKLTKLLDELCPDGVEYRVLGDLTELSIGKFVKKTKQRDDFEYPVYNGGAEPTGYFSEWNAEADSIVIAARGSIGFVNFVTTKFWAGNSSYVLKNLGESIDRRYLYHYLKHHEHDLYKLRSTGSIPAINKKPLSQMLIGIPPLEVQQEIVRVLDAFTDLEQSLVSELELRKKQLAVSHEGLLEEVADQSELLSLESACSQILAGGDKPKDCVKSQTSPTEERPFPVFSNGTGRDSLYGYSSECRVNAEAVTIAARGSVGHHAVRAAGFTPIIRLITLIPNSEVISAKYLNCALDTLSIDGTSGGISQLTVPMVKKLSIPVPPLEIQQEIVAKLDSLEALIGSIEQEISLRRQQYEFYRDELLSFAPKED